MNASWAEGVAETFSLGTPGEVVELSGGRAHRVWRMETSTGAYVAKALNPYHAGDARGVALIRDKIRLELAAKAQDVRMPAPVASSTGDFLAHLPGPAEGPGWWRVHEWVKGSHPGWNATPVTTACWIGRTLGVVHGLATPRIGELPGLPLAPLDQWRMLAERATSAAVDWAPLLSEGLDTIAAASAYAADRFAPAGLLYSHAECDQRNVIVDDDGLPYLLDWDSQIYVHPMAELFAAALNWAGVNEGRPDLEVAAAVVHAYTDLAPLQGRLADHAGYWLAWQLGWVWFSATRALGDAVAPVDIYDQPARDITNKLSFLPQWLDTIEAWDDEISRPHP